MKLKEKFLNSACEKGYINTNEYRAENNVKIAEDFAIGFMKWFYENAYLIEWLSNDNKREQLLKAYKKHYDTKR